MDRIHACSQDGGWGLFKAKEINVSRSGEIQGLYLWENDKKFRVMGMQWGGLGGGGGGRSL